MTLAALSRRLPLRVQFQLLQAEGARARRRRKRLAVALAFAITQHQAIHDRIMRALRGLRTQWVFLRSSGFWDVSVPVRLVTAARAQSLLRTPLTAPAVVPGGASFGPACRLPQNMSETSWLALLRMSQPTFEWLLEQLLPWVTAEDTRFRDSVRPDLRLALGLYTLAHNVGFRPAAAHLGVGTETARRARYVVVEGCSRQLFEERVQMPRRGEALERTVAGFEQLGVRRCVGTMDGTHVPIRNRGFDVPRDWLCRKGFFSTNCLVRAWARPRGAARHRPGAGRVPACMRRQRRRASRCTTF